MSKMNVFEACKTYLRILRMRIVQDGREYWQTKFTKRDSSKRVKNTKNCQYSAMPYAVSRQVRDHSDEYFLQVKKVGTRENENSAPIFSCEENPYVVTISLYYIWGPAKIWA